jgi:hypothetical protein
MKTLLSWAALLVLCLGICIAQLFVENYLGSPLRYISLPIVAVCLMVVFWQQKIWFCTVFLGFILELLSHYPFGLASFALVCAAIVLQTLLRRIFTSLSVYVIGGSVLAANAVALVAQKVGEMLFGYALRVNWVAVGWSFLLSTLLTLVLYFGITAFLQRINPAYIRF